MSKRPGTIRRVQTEDDGAPRRPSSATAGTHAQATPTQLASSMKRQESLSSSARGAALHRMDSAASVGDSVGDAGSQDGDPSRPTRAMKRNQRRSMKRLEKRMSSVLARADGGAGGSGDGRDEDGQTLEEILAAGPPSSSSLLAPPAAPASRLPSFDYGPVLPLDGPGREKWLRKTLLQFVTKDELDRFFADARFVGEGHPNLLSVVYGKLLRMPMFARRGQSFRTVLDRFILFLPEFNARYYRATGHDFSKRLINGIAGSLTMSLQSTEERRNFRRANRAALAMAAAQPSDVVSRQPTASSMQAGAGGVGTGPMATGAKTRKERGARRREMLDAVAGVLMEVESEEGLKALLDSIAAAHSVRDLPPSLRRMFALQSEMLTSKIDKVRGDVAVKSFKRTFHAIPRRSIMALLKVAQPSTLLKGLVALATTSAFGGTSALQRLFEGKVGLSACEEDLAVASRKVEAAVHERVRALVRHKLPYDVHGYMAENVAAYLDGVPIVSNARAGSADATAGRNPFAHRKWRDDELRAIHVVIVLEGRLRDKRHFIDAVAGPDVHALIDEVLPALQELLGDMINGGGFARLVSRAFEAWEAMADIVDDRTLSDDARLRRIRASVDTLQDAMFQFLHRAIIRDTGAVREMLVWLVTSQYRASAGFDIRPLVDSLPTGDVPSNASGAPAATPAAASASAETGGAPTSPTEGSLHRALWAELDTIAHYHKYVLKAKGERKSGAPPPPLSVKIVPMLLPRFHAMLLEHLGSEDTSVYSTALRRVSRSLGLVRDDKTRSASTDVSSATPSNPQRRAEECVTHIELTQGDDVGAFLSSDGWHRTEHDLKLGTGASSIHLYYKKSPMPSTPAPRPAPPPTAGKQSLARQESDMGGTTLTVAPVTSLFVSSDAADAPALLGLGYVRIQQNLNKGTFGRKMSLWYKRGEEGKRPIAELATSVGRDDALAQRGFERIDVSTNKGNMGKPVFIWFRRV